MDDRTININLFEARNWSNKRRCDPDDDNVVDDDGHWGCTLDGVIRVSAIEHFVAIVGQ